MKCKAAIFTTALPGGNRNNNGNFNNLTNNANFWSSTVTSFGAWGRYLSYDNEYVNRGDYNKTYGISARCVRN